MDFLLIKYPKNRMQKNFREVRVISKSRNEKTYPPNPLYRTYTRFFENSYSKARLEKEL